MHLQKIEREIPLRSADAAPTKNHALVYNTLAPEYHKVRFGDRRGRYDFEETRALIRDLMPVLLAGRSKNWLALDLACGTGKIAVSVAQLRGKVVALDAAPMMLHQCLRRSRDAGIREKLFPVNAAAKHLPFRDSAFDVVFSFRFLHLFPAEEYPNLLREMARVVKPGGYIVVEVKNRWYGGLRHWTEDLFRALRGQTTFSSCMTIRQMRLLTQQIGNLTLQCTHGLLLPKGWWGLERFRLSQVLRMLARQPLKSISAHLVVTYRKD
jgi:ubiquinone/menaquinone biosynthesis C-methylase UbiE